MEIDRKYTVLVTGANSDIGVEVCRYFLDRGNDVIAMVHNSHNNLDGIIDDHLKIIKLDFSNHKNIEDFILVNKELLDDVDIFISLSSIRKSVQYGNIDSVDLITHFTVNVIPVVLLVQYLGNSMSNKGWGRIVIGSSIGVKFGGGNDTYCYSLTKYATELIPKVAQQWAGHGVLTNIVRIGVTDTKSFRKIGLDSIHKRVELVPMRRLADPVEISQTICWLGSRENSYITGEVLAVSGGE
jgi:NAD(P)-dependent dehydrogenase (short-subunit alcohol dehydrogenase family)